MRFFAGFALVVFSPLLLAAQGAHSRTVLGLVVDSTGSAVAHSNIVINGRRRVVADDSGRFRIVADGGKLRLTVRRIGFEESVVTLPLERDTSIRIVLAFGPELLPSARAGSLEANGFYRRLAEADTGSGGGHFVTPEEIAQRQPYRTSQMLEGIAGVRLSRSPNDSRGPLGANRCPMTVYLDRARLNTLADRGAVVLVDEVVPATALAGIEVYLYGVKMPPDFQPMNGTCGVLLIWTK